MFADDVRVCSRPTRVVLLQLKFLIIVHRERNVVHPDDQIVARDRRGKYPSAARALCDVACRSVLCWWIFPCTGSYVSLLFILRVR
jgi:hypothetical protein